MRLKIFLTTSLICAFGSLAAWPWIMGQRPADGAKRAELAQYGVRLLTYFGVTAFLFLLTAFLAILLVRQTQREFSQAARENLRDLVEGSTRDHRKPDEHA